MDYSCYVTVNDIELIDLAFKRLLDHLNRVGCSLTHYLGLVRTNLQHELSQSFVSTSLHPPCEIRDLQSTSTTTRSIFIHHGNDCWFLWQDLWDYLGFVFQRLDLIPWNSDEQLSSDNVFKLFQSYLSFEDYKYMMSSQLRKFLRKIVPRERLWWILSLLFDFHYGHECKMFLSCVFKLYFKVFQFFPYRYYLENKERKCERDCFFMSVKLVKCLNIIQRYQCDEHILAKAFELFYFPPYMNLRFFERIPDLQYTLENLQKKKFQVMSSLLNNHEPGRLKNCDLCLLVNLQNAVTLITFGATSVYSAEDWYVMQHEGMPEYDFDLINFDTAVHVYGRFSLRLNQICRLFRMGEINERFSSEAEFALKILWTSIPDPYLTQEEVENYLNEPIDFMVLTEREPINFNSFTIGSYYREAMRRPRYYIRYLPENCCETIDIQNFGIKIDMQDKSYRTSKYYINKLSIPSFAGTSSATRVMQAWLWYKKIVLDGESILRSPRSLLHLSRYAVRQRLAENFQLPGGVKLLGLPGCIVNYLLMKDCGSNPFEEEYYLTEKILRINENE